ncbi:MAG: hypothetical protein GTN81_14110 [Proteobacteria bacterium]|nr:hypothetical protein [Pseudomonadota bacterium]
MNMNFILPLSIVLGLLTYSLIAKWYVMPALSRRPKGQALIPLLLPHCFRYIGMAFLIPGVTAEVLDPRFANPAAWGDLLAAVLALIAIIALRLQTAVAIPLVWVFNIEGSLDLLNALFQGFRHTQDGHLGAAYFIPAVAVPALLVTHYMIFVLLMRREKTTGTKV